MMRLKLALRTRVTVASTTLAIYVFLLASVWDLPAEALATFILAALGLGEFTQRIENVKTAEAYRDTYVEPEE